MRQINTLISELPSNLIHPIQTTHNQHLQIQLRRNTHEQIHIQIIMMRDERLSRRTPRNLIHHRCLHFQEVHLVEVRAHELDDLGAGDEGVSCAAVDDQVEETLAVARFLVLETEVLGGELAEAGCEELDAASKDG